MIVTDTVATQGFAPEQVYEIQTMAEGGQFADALIRLRKVKSHYPNTTYFVALEKQLERLLVLPRDTEPTESQKKELLESLPGLIQGAVRTMQAGPAARPAAPPPPPPRPATPDRLDREAAKTQLKEQYFQHADEYLKKGAYGSALVEIRRVKIIAPEDKTALEYERTIRQLVELQQRSGVPAPDGGEVRPEPTPEAVEAPAPAQPAPVVKEFGFNDAEPVRTESEVVDRRQHAGSASRGKGRVLIGVLIILLVSIGAATAFLPAIEETGEPAGPPERTAAQLAPVRAEAPAPVPSSAEPPAGQTSITQPEGSGTAAAVPAPTVAPARPEPGPATQQPASTPVQTADRVETATQDAPQPPVARESDPRIVDLVRPVFPPEVLALPPGEVIIMVQIDTDGTPVKTMVARSTNPAFNQPIVTAVLRSTYRPGSNADGPAVKWLTIPFKVN